MKPDRRSVDFAQAVVDCPRREMDPERRERVGVADVHEATRDGRLPDASSLQPPERHNTNRRRALIAFDALNGGHDREVGAEAGERLYKGTDAPRGGVENAIAAQGGRCR